jgi:hypothetical protein
VIATEVQRTLVKSPPELWTELSDPNALARHLGALGEIRITRTEPERLVEWEAAGTTGTVAIKASGWGTKVTLTVNRELPAGDEPGPEDEPAVPSDEGGVEHTRPTEVAAEGEQDPLDEGGSESADVASDEATDETIAFEHTPAPATEAARRAAGWPGPAADAGPAIESDLRAAEAAPGGEAVVLPEDTPEALAASAPAQETQDEPDDIEPSVAPRRGFFARLFGRRRRPDTAAEPPPGEGSDGAPASELIADEPLAELGEELDAELTEEAIAEEPVAELGEEPVAELGEEPVAEVGEEPVAEVGEEPVAELAEEPAAPPEGEPLSSAEASAPPEPAVDLHAEPAEQPSAGSEPPSASTQSAGAEAQAAGDGLAAELKAAEEVAADEVTAVLTAVLDRLGAAHHRPFSRA